MSFFSVFFVFLHRDGDYDINNVVSVPVVWWVIPRHCTVDPMLLLSGNSIQCHQEVLSWKPMFPLTKRFDIFPVWGMFRRLRCVQIFLVYTEPGAGTSTAAGIYYSIQVLAWYELRAWRRQIYLRACTATLHSKSARFIPAPLAIVDTLIH